MIKRVVPLIVCAAAWWGCSADGGQSGPTDDERSGASAMGDRDAGSGSGRNDNPSSDPSGADGGSKSEDPTGVVYGKSQKGQDLVYHEIASDKPNGKKALLVFSIHGFEDAWKKDGAALFAIANKTIEHYGKNLDDLHGWSAYVVPTANPDGMRYGVNNAREEVSGAYGRCAANGKDINRNFSTASFAEHDALKSLVDDIKPTVIIDFHGWYNCYYGNSGVGDFFANAFNGKFAGKPAKYCYVRSTGVMDCGATLGGTFHKNTTISDDLFAEWAMSVRKIPSIILEYPAPDFDGNGEYDVETDATGAMQMKASTLDVLFSRTTVALTDMFTRY